MPNSPTVKTNPQKSIAVMVLSSPHASGHSQTALQYCRSAIAAGHSIYRIFFYHEAAYLANTQNCSPQDEIALPESWQKLIATNNIDAVVCIASGLKRGMLTPYKSLPPDKKTTHTIMMLNVLYDPYWYI